MNIKTISTLCIVALFPTSASGNNPDFKTVEGGALYLIRLGVETHRAEFLSPEDCQHVASIMNRAEPSVRWHCSTSVPDIVLSCEISGFELDADAESWQPESLEFSLTLNRAVARSWDLPPALTFFEYSESDSGYLLTNDFPYPSGHYLSRAIYHLVIDSKSGEVTVRDIGGRNNGSGKCTPVEISYRPLRGRYEEGPSKGPSISQVPVSPVSSRPLPASGCNRG